MRPDSWRRGALLAALHDTGNGGPGACAKNRLTTLAHHWRDAIPDVDPYYKFATYGMVGFHAFVVWCIAIP